MKNTGLSPNQLAFLALANEYCVALEHVGEVEPYEFTDLMLRLLPRLYMSATDLQADSFVEEFLPAALDEDSYDNVRRSIAMLYGEDDTYLEVFEQDMKYSDTPIATTISEGLADIFQELYNLVEAAKDAPSDLIDQYLCAVRDDFASFWSQTLCNTLRPLNSLKYN